MVLELLSSHLVDLPALTETDCKGTAALVRASSRAASSCASNSGRTTPSWLRLQKSALSASQQPLSEARLAKAHCRSGGGQRTDSSTSQQAGPVHYGEGFGPASVPIEHGRRARRHHTKAYSSRSSRGAYTLSRTLDTQTLWVVYGVYACWIWDCRAKERFTTDASHHTRIHEA